MKKEKGKENPVVTEARDRFKLCQEAYGDNHRRAESAIRFRALDQWPDKLKKDRESNGRPCLVVDKTNQYIRQVINDQRQNRASIKARPVDDKADKDVAEVIQGIIRHIEDSSNAELAYDTGFEHAVEGGFGYWRVLTEYADDEGFEQDIRIKRIPNRFTVMLDPDHQEPDGSDAKYAFIVDEMTKEDYESQYGDDPIDWEMDSNHFDDWISKDKVRVVEYFRLEHETSEKHFLEDGTIHEGPLNEGVKALKTRTTKRNKVKWSKLNGKDELEKADWVGKYIPIVEVVGNEIYMPDGKRRLSGMVEAMMDAMRMHNYARSAFVEMVALAPKSPFLAATGQTEGHEEEWAKANSENIPVLHYNPIDVAGHPVPPPIRQPMQGIPAGWAQILQDTEHDIQGSAGMYQASVGAPSNEKSGKAIMARQREGDTATFHYIDNHARSIKHTGRILIDLIPKIYDTKRVARIIGEDGAVEAAELNPDMQAPVMDKIDPVTNKVIGQIYNPTIGKYDVTVSVGPSYTTKRQEAAEFITGAMQAAKDPATASVLTYLAIKNQDVPGADEATQMLKKLLPPQVLESEDDEGDKEAQIQQMAMMIEQKGQMLMQKEQELMALSEQLTQMKQDVEAEGQQTEKSKMSMETMLARIESQTKILAAQRAQFNAEAKLFEEQMRMISEGQEKTAQENDSKREQNENMVAAISAIVEKLNQPKRRRAVVQRMEDGTLVGDVIEGE